MSRGIDWTGDFEVRKSGELILKVDSSCFYCGFPTSISEYISAIDLYESYEGFNNEITQKFFEDDKNYSIVDSFMEEVCGFICRKLNVEKDFIYYPDCYDTLQINETFNLNVRGYDLKIYIKEISSYQR